MDQRLIMRYFDGDCQADFEHAALVSGVVGVDYLDQFA